MSKADKRFVDTVRIQNFGCARDVTLELTRLHALIGPNDSGKSTVLAAIRTAGELIRLGEPELADRTGLDPRGVAGTSITMCSGAFEVTCARGKTMWSVYAGPRGDRPDRDRPLEVPFRDEIADPMRGASLLRWDPETIRRPCELIPEGRPLAIGERGQRTAAVYDALLSRNPAPLLLMEEPENGLHPSRIAEVVKVLREVSNRMQVIIATHSPLVINELQPNEVTILTRDEKAGTRATRMDRTKHFQQRQQVYALGELWLSFADGVDEAALVQDSDPSSPAG